VSAGYISVKRRASTNKPTKRKAKGMVYVLEISIDGVNHYKVGITARGGNALESRVMEISVSFFRVYGYFPQIVPLRNVYTEWYYEVETWMHKKLVEWAVVTKEFDGHTEVFGCTKVEVLKWYDIVMAKPIDFVTPSKEAIMAQADIVDLTDIPRANDIEPTMAVDEEPVYRV